MKFVSNLREATVLVVDIGKHRKARSPIDLKAKKSYYAVPILFITPALGFVSFDRLHTSLKSQRTFIEVIEDLNSSIQTFYN